MDERFAPRGDARRARRAAQPLRRKGSRQGWGGQVSDSRVERATVAAAEDGRWVAEEKEDGVEWAQDDGAAAAAAAAWQSYGGAGGGNNNYEADGSFRTRYHDDAAYDYGYEHVGGYYADGGESYAAYSKPDAYAAPAARQTYYYSEELGAYAEPYRGRQRRGAAGVRAATGQDAFSLTRHGRYDEVEALLDSGLPVDTRDVYGNTILAVACQNGLKRIAKLALRRGADINAANYRGNTALHYCYAYSYGPTLGAYLISKGASPLMRNEDGLLCHEFAPR